MVIRKRNKAPGSQRTVVLRPEIDHAVGLYADDANRSYSSAVGKLLKEALVLRGLLPPPTGRPAPEGAPSYYRPHGWNTEEDFRRDVEAYKAEFGAPEKPPERQARGTDLESEFQDQIAARRAEFGVPKTPTMHTHYEGQDK